MEHEHELKEWPCFYIGKKACREGFFYTFSGVILVREKGMASGYMTSHLFYIETLFLKSILMLVIKRKRRWKKQIKKL